MQLVLGFTQQPSLCARAAGYQPKLDESRLSVVWNEEIRDLTVVDELGEGIGRPS